MLQEIISGIILDVKNINTLEMIDYLVIGHITIDKTAHGLKLGGTAAYVALTVKALGWRVGVVTSWGEEIPASELDGLTIVNIHTAESTKFENLYCEKKRNQIIKGTAAPLKYEHIPEPWQNSKVVHIGPVAREVDQDITHRFPNSLVGITPQGWFRDWDTKGNVLFSDWREAKSTLQYANAIVISPEDVGFNEERIEEMVTYCPVVVVTEAEAGARLYWHGDVRRFRAPSMNEVDPTGAGDIFAAAFFIRLSQTRDPWGAARFATNISAFSVQRTGLNAIPTDAEIKQSMVEVL